MIIMKTRRRGVIEVVTLKLDNPKTTEHNFSLAFLLRSMSHLKAVIAKLPAAKSIRFLIADHPLNLKAGMIA